MCAEILLHLLRTKGIVKIILSKHSIKETVYNSITKDKLWVLTAKVLKGIVVRVLAEDAMTAFRSDIHEKLEVHDAVVYFWVWSERIIQIECPVLTKLG